MVAYCISHAKETDRNSQSAPMEFKMSLIKKLIDGIVAIVILMWVCVFGTIELYLILFPITFPITFIILLLWWILT